MYIIVVKKACVTIKSKSWKNEYEKEKNCVIFLAKKAVKTEYKPNNVSLMWFLIILKLL